jgi:hypothetical protein
MNVPLIGQSEGVGMQPFFIIIAIMLLISAGMLMFFAREIGL